MDFWVNMLWIKLKVLALRPEALFKLSEKKILLRASSESFHFHSVFDITLLNNVLESEISFQFYNNVKVTKKRGREGKTER